MSRPHREPSSRNGRARAAFAVAFAGAMWTTPASAEDPEPITPRVELRHNLWLDVGATVGISGATLAWALAKPSVLPTSCVICESGTKANAIDEWFRDALKRQDTGPASTASDIFGYGAAPVFALGLSAASAVADRRADEAPLDLLLVAEATSVDVALDQLSISFLRRERPSFHAIADPDEKEGSRTLNTVSSFPSGHTSAAFAMAASAGTIASMRGYRLAPLVWIVGMTIGGATAYLRIAADRHYFTDTLAGAGLGVATGIGVPWFFHSPRRSILQNASISTEPAPGGRVVTLRWAF